MSEVAERMTERCRDCKTRIVWLRHKDTGRMAPVEAKENEQGNVRVTIDRARLRREYEFVKPGSEPGLHLNHAATCIYAEGSRNERG